MKLLIINATHSFGGQSEKNMCISDVCTDCLGENILMVQHNSEFLINKHKCFCSVRACPSFLRHIYGRQASMM